MPWRAILDGAARDEARAALGELAASLLAVAPIDGAPRRDDPWLALAFAYLREEGLANPSVADAYLARAVEAAASEPFAPSLHGGLAGVAWTVDHLHPSDGGDDDDEVEGALLAHVSRSPWEGSFDLLRGLVGFGVYALERRPSPQPNALLETVVARLDETAREMGPGVAWWTPPELMGVEAAALHPDGYFDVGVAHGVPGVIGLLARTVEAGVAVDRATSLLRGAVAWLRSVRREGSDGSQFPFTVGPGARDRCRAAWCYGDPAIAVVLLSAARAVGDSGWEAMALDVGARAVARPAETTGVVDAGLCHGAAGLAHLYNRLYQATGDERFRVGAVTWYRRLLGGRRPGEGLAGFVGHVADGAGQMSWRGEPSLLTGGAGVALALLAAVSSRAPDWDRLLLASLPAR